MTKIDTRKILVRGLAKHFSDGHDIMCACVGQFRCGYLGCEAVWEYLLDHPEELINGMTMYDMFENNRRELKKKFGK